MDIQTTAICTAITANSGSFKNDSNQEVNFDSTTFHLLVDLGESKGNKIVIGNVSRPFKYGDSKEIQKWKNHANNWPVGGLPVAVQFGMQASGDGVKLILKDIRPAPVKG